MSLRLIAVGFCFALSSLNAAEPTLAARLQPIIDAHKGQIAVAVKHLEIGEVFAHKADDVMPTASLIKMAVMVETCLQADEKKIDLGKSLTLTKEDKVPGAGVLTHHITDGIALPLKDYVRLMIVYSDNTATNVVLDQVGIKNVNTRMESLGLKNTKINAKVFKGSTTSVDPDRTKKYGLGSTTANESVALLEMLHVGKVVSPDVCKTMLGHLKANEDHQMLVRLLPENTVVAHKTGAVSNARTEAGIIYVPSTKDSKKTQPVAVCVLTNENDDKRWMLDNAAQVTIAEIGKAVYEHYNSKDRN